MQLSCVLLVALNLSTSSIRADVPGTRPLYRSLTATKNAQPQDALTRGAAIALLTVTAIIILAGAATQMRKMSLTLQFIFCIFEEQLYFMFDINVIIIRNKRTNVLVVMELALANLYLKITYRDEKI